MQSTALEIARNLCYDTHGCCGGGWRMISFQLDDKIYQLAREAAAAKGLSVDEFVAVALRAAAGEPIVRLSQRNGFPIFEVVGGKTIDAETVQRFIQEEGF
jgi:hypothetical protein